MPKKPTVNVPCPSEYCHARRHMPDPAFRVYDTMLAMAKSDKKREPGAPLECFARLATIQNHCDISEGAARRAIKRLVADGWLRPMSQLGSHGSNRYRVLEHPEHASQFPCPSIRFDPETGKPIGRDMNMSLAFLWRILPRLRGGHLEFGWEGDKAYLRRPEGQPGTDAGLGKGQPCTHAGLEEGVNPAPVKSQPCTDAGQVCTKPVRKD